MRHRIGYQAMFRARPPAEDDQQNGQPLTDDPEFWKGLLDRFDDPSLQLDD